MTQKLSIASANDLLQQLPASLRMRLESIVRYASAMAEEPLTGIGKPKLSRSSVEKIRKAAIIYVLREFLQRGAHAAKSSVSTFEDLGFRGFAVGNTAFTRNSEATLRGDRLVRALDSTLRGTPLALKIRTSRNIRDFIQSLARDLHNA
jgi:hypothetical protein